MENDIRLRYGSARPGVLEVTPITVLHIGEEQTAVMEMDAGRVIHMTDKAGTIPTFLNSLEHMHVAT